MRKFFYLVFLIGILSLGAQIEAKESCDLTTSEDKTIEIKEKTTAFDNPTTTLLETKIKKNFSESFRITDNDVIIFVTNLKGDMKIDEVLKLKIFTLNEDKMDPNYLYEVNDIYVLALGDGDKFDPYKLEVKIEQLESKFKESFTGMISLIKELSNSTQGILEQTQNNKNKPEDSTKFKLRLIKIPNKKIKDPCLVKIIPLNENKTENSQALEVKIHEKNWVQFKVGIAAGNIVHKNYQLKDGYVFVNDSAKREELKSNLNVGFEFYFLGGRDVDRSKTSFLFDKGWTGIGLFLGLNLSTDPLKTLTAGFSFPIYQDVSLMIGCSWIRTDDNQITNVGEITSLDEAKNYLDRSYQRNLVFGLSVSPNSVIKALGLNSDSKKEEK